MRDDGFFDVDLLLSASALMGAALGDLSFCMDEADEVLSRLKASRDACIGGKLVRFVGDAIVQAQVALTRVTSRGIGAVCGPIVNLCLGLLAFFDIEHRCAIKLGLLFLACLYGCSQCGAKKGKRR